ncbi:MAG: hypothetical protein K9K66_09985 [Desulfarculaceae bacterium]|nr:hypothetical protein [Desulfarculaceae bacterium]MCF8073738.1 hypothetical protein [Desulfarculaceae bacterium]MCF8101979.1 hypothetical protein [Desulfarculaceae bacterium]MCF8115949.1 hypothetical protein [Desulfarculaceae bacterium]
MLDRRWIDTILWCCLWLMLVSSLALIWGLAQGAPGFGPGPLARVLVQP